MRKHHLFCLLFLFYYLTGPLVSNSQVQKIYLHPKSKTIGKQSQFVDSIRFIPLEVKDDIKLDAYNVLELAGKFLMLNLYNVSTLILYTNDGRFVKKISYKGLGTGSPYYEKENNRLVFSGNNKNYVLTPKDEVKIKLDWTNPRNKKYFKKYVIDLNDPTFAIQKAPITQNDIIKSYRFYDDYYSQGDINTSSLYKDSLDYEFKIFKNNQLVKGFFPYNHINEPRFLYSDDDISLSSTADPYVHFLSRPYCDTIYKLYKDSIVPEYQIVLPLENSLPASFYTNSPKNKIDRDNYRKNNGSMYSHLYSFYETPTYLFLFVRYLYNSDMYIYEKKNNITYITKTIRTDSSQYDLKLLDGYNIRREGDWFYKPMKASNLVPFFEKHKDITIPKELETFIASKPPADAPVVVVFKFKN